MPKTNNICKFYKKNKYVKTNNNKKNDINNIIYIS